MQRSTWLSDLEQKQIVSVITSKGAIFPVILSSCEICLDLGSMKAFTSEPDATFTLQSVNLMHCKPYSQVTYFWVFAKNLPLESWLYVFEQMYVSSFAWSWKARCCVWPNKLAFAVSVPRWVTIKVSCPAPKTVAFLGTLLTYVHQSWLHCNTFCHLAPRLQYNDFGLLF